MKRLSIILFVGLIGVSVLALYTPSALSEGPSSLSAHFDSMWQNNVSSAVSGLSPASLLLVGGNFEKYDVYKYGFNRSLPPDLNTYYDLYGIPIDDLLKKWLKYGGYIGSPLGRSKRDLYDTCLLYARYTYQCQNGEQTP
jgi:hypothetical protein